MNSSTRPVKTSGRSTFERWPARGMTRCVTPGTPARNRACADPEDEVERAVDHQDRAAVGQRADHGSGRPAMRRTAWLPPLAKWPPAVIAAPRTGAVAAPEPGRAPRRGPRPRARAGASRRRAGRRAWLAPVGSRVAPAMTRLRTRSGMPAGDGHRDVAAQRQADERGTPARRLVDRADDAGDGVIELERAVPLRAVPGQVDADAPVPVRKRVDLGPPHRAAHQRAVDEHDRRGIGRPDDVPGDGFPGHGRSVGIAGGSARLRARPRAERRRAGSR